jgi:transposase-like protein
MAKRKKKQVYYPVEVKRAAVERLRAGERAAALASELGCRPGRLYRWREEWEKDGGWVERRHRRRSLGPPGSGPREAELERLIGQQQAELDFLREALRRIEQARRPTVEPRAPSPGSSSAPRRLVRKAG